MMKTSQWMICLLPRLPSNGVTIPTILLLRQLAPLWNRNPRRHLHKRRKHTLKHLKRDEHEVEPDDLADDLAESVAATDALARSLARLNEDQRTAVVLRYYAQLSEQQIASVLGVGPGTVKSRLSRALRLLAEDPTLADLRGLA